MAKKERWSVTVRAFDRISTRTFEAESKAEAEERALAEVHFSVKSKKQFHQPGGDGPESLKELLRF